MLSTELPPASVERFKQRITGLIGTRWRAEDFWMMARWEKVVIEDRRWIE